MNRVKLFSSYFIPALLFSTLLIISLIIIKIGHYRYFQYFNYLVLVSLVITGFFFVIRVINSIASVIKPNH